MRTHDIILTGLPRSGTTLCCHLLNQVRDTVALHEPMRPHKVRRWMHPTLMGLAIGRFFSRSRRSIETTKRAISKNINGKVPSNPYADHRDRSGLRTRIENNGEIEIGKRLAPNFNLVIKQPGFFTALLPTLVWNFPCFGVVRNPLSVLASWSSVPTRHGDGHSPAAEMMNNGLRRNLNRLADRIDRQLCLLGWFFEQYRLFLPDEAVLRYETIVETGGKSLRIMVPEADSLDVPLQSRNFNKVYDPALIELQGKRLLASDGAYWAFYDRNSVRQVIERCAQNTLKAA